MRVLVATLALLVAMQARAEHRFAVSIGNNHGLPDEPVLRFAEEDARKVSEVLQETGGFHAEDVVVLTGGNVTDIRRALLTVNDRARAEEGSVVVVYFSGHASAEGLHIEGEELSLEELEHFVRGSAASFRVLIVDACRSGALTEVKGGKPAPAYSLTSPPTEGYVVLTAAAAGEDAQESEELRGSFFTHFLASGLLGAADANADRQVTLDEAYNYAFAATVASSSRTLAGTQHPTFRYDLKGKGELVLSSFGNPEHAQLGFKEPLDFIVFDDGGAVVAEVSGSAPNRSVVVPAGTLVVRARGVDAAFEGKVTAQRGQTLEVSTDMLERFEYARLVRKGIGERRVAASPSLSVGLANPLVLNTLSVAADVPFAFRGFSVGPTAAYHLIPEQLVAAAAGRGEAPSADDKKTPGHVVTAYGTVTNTIDLPWLSLFTTSGVGLAVAVNQLRRGDVSGGPGFILGAGVQAPLFSPVFVRASCDLEMALLFGSSDTADVTLGFAGFVGCAPGIGVEF
jgi:hypothetical protein